MNIINKENLERIKELEERFNHCLTKEEAEELLKQCGYETEKAFNDNDWFPQLYGLYDKEPKSYDERMKEISFGGEY